MTDTENYLVVAFLPFHIHLFSSLIPHSLISGVAIGEKFSMSLEMWFDGRKNGRLHSSNLFGLNTQFTKK